MNPSDIRIIASALRKARPVDLLINDTARHQWYADVSAITEALELHDSKFNPAKEFFDLCGVPS